MPVLDASVLAEYLTLGSHAEAAGDRIFDDSEARWAPELVDAEVGHVLRREERRGDLDEDDAGEALWQLDQLPVERVSHEMLLRSAWELRHNVTFYDALYVALAEMLDEPLVTFDARLARAGVGARVEVLG